MYIRDFANEICKFLNSIPQIKSSKLYGSLYDNSFDEYSDIDIEIDVSGVDNGEFLISLPKLILNNYGVIFYDFAPSLAPDKYIVSIAIDKENPFMLVDIRTII